MSFVLQQLPRQLAHQGNLLGIEMRLFGTRLASRMSCRNSLHDDRELEKKVNKKTTRKKKGSVTPNG
jgi:hypothetical protein